MSFDLVYCANLSAHHLLYKNPDYKNNKYILQKKVNINNILYVKFIIMRSNNVIVSRTIPYMNESNLVLLIQCSFLSKIKNKIM